MLAAGNKRSAMVKRIVLAIFVALLPAAAWGQFIGATSYDPCSYGTKITINIGQTATSKIISGSPGKKTYICAGAGFTSAAAVYGIEEGTGSVCGTGTYDVAGMNGSNNGTPFMSLAANGGLTFGAGSGSHIVVGNAAGDDVCLVQSGTANFSGWVSVVQQ